MIYNNVFRRKQLWINFAILYFFSNLFLPPLYSKEPSSSSWCLLELSQSDGNTVQKEKIVDIEGITKTTLTWRNSYTKISPSHIGHPGYEDVAFLYDKAVDALILKAAGYQKEPEEILDYFVTRLRIPIEEINRRVDTNSVYGILKLFKPKGSSQGEVKSFVNALDITSMRRQGKGALEFWTTPGPISFLIFAMLQVNVKKYYADALVLGEALLAMQDSQGGIHDGDRAPNKIHTEPHMDAYSAFLMLYKITQDLKWKVAANKAYDWFIKNVYHAKEGIIDQGLWFGRPSTIFATDVYSWTMAGPCADKLSLQALGALTETMLSASLVKITFVLPDSHKQTIILCDFSNPQESRVKYVRGGFHPMGSVEWTGGVILALQKNAVRFYNAKNTKTAAFYKALAEILFGETMKCFYSLDASGAKITFYATAQGVEVGPFGSIEDKLSSGWKTPFFYVKNSNANSSIKGGSAIGAWPLLPYFGLNPFMLDDQYQQAYKQISFTQKDLSDAKAFINSKVVGRSFEEIVPAQAPSIDTQIVEPELFNRKMWQALENAYAQKNRKNYVKAEASFEQVIYWAKKIVDNPTWIRLARRDNLQKEKEIGGIVSYPWGATYPNNDHALHYSILRYPILNEVAAAMWAMAVADFELGNYTEAKHWIRRIIEEVPFHQIADTAQGELDYKGNLIRGYWNALVSWEDNPGGYERDEKMKPLYLEVLKEKGLASAKPKVVMLIPDKFR